MKYELVKTDTKQFEGKTLYRIRALTAIGLLVAAGDLGGYVECEKNLDQGGDAWVYGNALVSGNARVSGNAWVYGNARVYGNALVYGNAQVFGDAWVYGNALGSGNARVYGNALVYGDARVYGNAQVYGDARVYGNARVYSNVWVYGNAWVSGDIRYSLDNLTCSAAATELRRLHNEILVYHDDRLKLSNEVDRLRAALGLIASLERKPADEPVACGHCNGSGRMVRYPDIGTDQECFVCDGSGVIDTPPAAQRQWVGLTQQDIDIAFDDTQEGGGFNEFAQAIEQRLKEKNT